MTSWNNLHSLSWQARLYLTSLQNMVTNIFPASLLRPVPMVTKVFSKLFIPVSHCPFSHSEILKCLHHPCQLHTASFPPKDSWHGRRDVTDSKILPMWVLWENIFKKKLEKFCFTSDYLLFLKYILHLQTSMTLLNSIPSTCKTGPLSRPKSNILPSHSFFWSRHPSCKANIDHRLQNN